MMTPPCIDIQNSTPSPAPAINLTSKYSHKLLSLPPCKSFLRLDCRQVLKYILGEVSTIQVAEHERDDTNSNPLEHFIEELRTSFDAICDQDYYDLLKQCDHYRFSAKIDRATRTPARLIDSSIILNWALIETSKFCLTQKLAPDNITTNQFLTILKQELGKLIKPDNHIYRLAFLKFLQYLDKLILDRISDSSHRMYTLNVSPDVELFIDVNKDILESWFFRNRQVSARSALVLGDAAECWRCISLRLWDDMATRFSFSNEHQQTQYCDESSSSRISVSQTLQSLDTKQWQSNLELFALCAKELGDIDLLHGIGSLVGFTEILSDKWHLASLALSNADLNFSKTYNDYLELVEDNIDPKRVDQLCLIEFLNACVELDRLGIQSDKIAWLQSNDMRFIYNHYLASKVTSSSKIDSSTAKNRFAQVKDWISTWSFEPQVTTEHFRNFSAYTNLTILTQMNNANCVDCDELEKSAMINDIRNVIKLNSTGRSLLDFNEFPEGLQIFEDILKLISGEENESIFKNSHPRGSNTRPSRQHHIAHRLMSDTRSVQTASRLTGHDTDQLQLHAAKFNLKNKNLDYAYLLGSDLDKRGSASELIRLHNRVLLLEISNDDSFRIDSQNLVAKICQTENLDASLKTRFLSKVFCRTLRRRPVKDLNDLSEVLRSTIAKNNQQLDEANSVPHSTVVDQIIRMQNLPTRTFSIIAESLDASLNSTQCPNPELLNLSFRTDIIFLSKAQEVSTMTSKRNMIIEAVVRILDKIKRYASDIDASNLAEFASPTFIDRLINHALFDLRNSVISLITYPKTLPSVWVEALTKIIKRVAAIEPNSILYETIVNRLDWQAKLAVDRASPTHRLSDASITLLQQHDPSVAGRCKSGMESSRIQLKFWNEIYKEMANSKSEVWRRQVLATEGFLKEIRRISYLPGEYIKTLTIRINHKLQQYLNLFMRYADPKTGLITDQKHIDECQSKILKIYQDETKSVEVIVNHLTQTMKQAGLPTCYDEEIYMDLMNPIKEVAGRLKQLANCADLSISKLDFLVKSIIKLLSSCRAQVIAINNGFRQKLFLEQISPVLSRMDPDSAIMPGYLLDNCSTGGSLQSRVEPVTIHKIGQGVQMIHSKTAPKKLTFTGSDGLKRSYLLKAHEDLRLDKKIMDLFGSINVLLEGDKKTRDFKYCLQRYSVTPVSSRSGLIQWVEARSLCSSYRTWFQSPNGRRIVGSLYKETCATLCPQQESDPEKHNCSLPGTNLTVDPFYQLLWAKIRNLPRTGAGSVQLVTHYGQVARPSTETTHKFRKVFPPSIYEEVLEKMDSVLPKDLIAHRLWFDSPHSMGFYLRTREFIRSCAAISMAGYVIGLGDRHPDNILLDSGTGGVIHIDYNVCFELGHQHFIPERVPFRLTQSMIHAFGFAGLEGGFERSCVRILNHMKENKSIILHHLDPVNLNFMIEIGEADAAAFVGSRASEDATPSGNNDPTKVADCSEQATGINVDVVSPLRRAISDPRPDDEQASAQCGSDLIVRCQEDEESAAASLELIKVVNREQHPNDMIEATVAPTPTKDQSPGGPHHSQDHKLEAVSQFSPDRLHLDIKTPTLISSTNADIIFKRVHSKLSGSDDLLLGKMYDHRARSGSASLVEKFISLSDSKATSQLSAGPGTNEDLILLIDEVLSTEDQVKALILEAISNKNKAAMFEGWSPWV